MASEPRVLAVTTTPGPSQALVGMLSALSGRMPVTVLSSTDSAFGQGCNVYARFGVPVTAVEDASPGYRPLHVNDAEAEALLNEFAPDAVLAGAVNEPSGELHPLEDMICRAASRAGIANAQFVEGWDVWHPRRWGPPEADIYLTVDKYATAMLRSHGIPEERIRIVGYPPSLIDPDRIDPAKRATVRAELGLDEDERLIVFFGQVTPETVTPLGWAANALKPRDRLVFQRHPRDTRPEEELLRNCPLGSVTISPLTTDRIIHATDVCVTHYSLVSFATATLGIPTVLTLMPNDVPNIRNLLGFYPTTLLGGTVECNDYDSLRRAFIESRPPDPTFIKTVRGSMGKFSDNVAACLFRASDG